ncbi:MAG: hypothetical protein BWY99_02668 [Synergistetes bacterium ADurb.BinA166]|nr:MAG: hypothetical protein BWY99_02668 [Synergistetes bacterium ADurb.BinA166]
MVVKTGPLISHSAHDRLALLEECSGRLEVRDLLVSANCVGARMSVSSCPVARFVGSGALVLSAYGVVEWTDRSGPDPVVRWWTMTKAVRHFVHNFDLRAYPELDWRRGLG